MNFILNRHVYGVLGVWTTLCATSLCAQKQELTFDDAKSLVVHVSASGLTRFSVKGDRLKEVIGLDETVNVIKDESNGHLFLKGVTTKQTITVVTEGGDLQDLTLIPDVKGSASIVLKTPNETKKPEFDVTPLPLTTSFNELNNVQGVNLKEVMIQVIKQLYMGLGSPVESRSKRTSLAGIEAVSFRKVSAQSLTGEVYRVTNHESGPTILLEKDFYQPGDLAIAMGQKQLGAGESTLIFIVRNTGV